MMSVYNLNRVDNLHFLRVVEISNHSFRIRHYGVSWGTLKLFACCWLIRLICHS